jgi:hypothetical protein
MMQRIVNLFIPFLFILTSSTLSGQPLQNRNLIVVTLDGFRWQELFNGADSSLLFDDTFTHDSVIQKQFWSLEAQDRREKLMPFVWNVLANEGQLYGNRQHGNRVDCANPYWFSYPGYSELFTGIVDMKIKSNRKIVNRNSTVFEFIKNYPGFEGNIGVFSTWDVIPYIVRAHSNGYESVPCHLAPPSGKPNDEHTFDQAIAYLDRAQPRVMFISFDGTDEHGHGGRYDEYLRSAHGADQMLRQLWQTVQQNEFYKDNTTLFITTDHGRGHLFKKSWKHHGRHTLGSNHIWLAVMGPETPPMGEMKSERRYFQKQVAKTLAAFMGMDYTNRRPVGEKIYEMLEGTPVVSVRSNRP